MNIGNSLMSGNPLNILDLSLKWKESLTTVSGGVDLLRNRGESNWEFPNRKAEFAKAVVIVYILINATIWGFVALHLLSQETFHISGMSPFDDVNFSHDMQKSDSDVVLIGDEYLSWPDKVSDVEEEYIWGTDWRDPDSDHDGMEDGWEIHHTFLEPIRQRWIIDPNNNDWNENPDGDGFDSDRNGVIEGNERLFNLREYCGGALYDSDTGMFESTEPIFGGLKPDDDWRKIGMKGGYHLYDDPRDGIVGDPENIDNDNFDDYRRYDPMNLDLYQRVTTDPSNSDTDGDGMDDGWEIHYGREIKEKYEITYQPKQLFPGIVYENICKVSIDPLCGLDAEYDFDLHMDRRFIGGKTDDVMIYRPDGLTNLEEFEYGTNPMLWDSDHDSFYNVLKNEYITLDDKTEALMQYLDEDFWSHQWDYSPLWNIFRLDPMDPDTDGDGMMDGWELNSGLNPLNSTDRFRDLDNDGLPNYLEFAFPSQEDVWFRTDPKNPDTDGDGMPDGWEAYNAKIISQTPALSTREDLEDKIADSQRTEFTVTPMIPDSEEDNDWFYEYSEDGDITYCRKTDGVTNLEEYLGTLFHPVSSDPNDLDTDDDGLLDGEEMKTGFHGEFIGNRYYTNSSIASIYHTNHTQIDTDNDFGGIFQNGQIGNTSRSLNDWEEVRGRTKEILPRNGFDDDGDGYIDEWEGEYLVFNPTNASNPDSDFDGLMDVDELFGIDTALFWDRSELGIIRTDPTRQDTDQDGLSDQEELEWFPNFKEFITDPTDPDSDDDSMTDWEEWNTDFFPMINWDRSDDPEYMHSSHFIDWDVDLSKYMIDKTNPLKVDTDGDGLSDGWEYRFGWITLTKENMTTFDLWPLSSTYTDNWRVGPDYLSNLPEGTKIWLINPLISSDLHDDPDKDGLTNMEEYKLRTHPLKADTDGDGMPDGWELEERNRYQPIYDNTMRRYRWTLDPLDPNDWYLDPDHDGVVFYTWSRSQYDPGRYLRNDYYFPWVNLYEYQFGEDIDHDGINEITTSPAPRLMDIFHLGGYDSDSDGLPDGYEIFHDDSDNDSLPTGWELFYNGTLWNEPETCPYRDRGNDWDPFDHALLFPETRLVLHDINVTRGKLNPNMIDTDMNGVNDGEENADGDANNNFEEARSHSDPTRDPSTRRSSDAISDDTRKVIDRKK